LTGSVISREEHETREREHDIKILAVDDDPFIRELFPSIFEMVDVTDIQTADGGASALQMIAQADTPFDCLILDVDMPHMDGIELCGRIRTLPTYRDKPVLMLTAKTDAVSIENAFVAGANDYISKPFNLKDIYNRIRVAERLLKASQSVKRVDPCNIVKDAPRGSHAFDVGQKLVLANVERLIFSFSLGNYLTQLDRRDLENCQVFCVALGDARTLYNCSTTEEFMTILTDLADAICETVTCPHLLMSYEGNGSFLCITRDTNLPQWQEIEAKLQQSIDDSSHVPAVRTKTALTVSVGPPISPNANRTQRVKKTFERAIGRAQTRHDTKRAAAAKRVS
jgi:CheY-like chemotaxis protein